MVDKNDVEKVKKPLDQLKKGTEFVAKYSETARELVDAGKEVKDLQKIAASLKGLDKFATAMGVASFGLSAVEIMIGGDEDKNDLILEAVKDLKDEIHEMWTDIGKRIDSFETKFEAAIASLKLFPALSALKSLKDDMKTYVLTGSDVNLTLGDNNTQKIKENFLAIGDNLKDSDDASALMTAYEAEDGSFTVMRGLVSMYLDIAFMLPSAYALVDRLSFEQGKTGALISQKQMQLDIEGPWHNIVDACQHILTKLSHEEDANIQTMLDNLPIAISHPQMLNGNGKIAPTHANAANPNPGENSFHIPAQNVLDKLTENWPDVFFWVIVGQKYLDTKARVVNAHGTFANTNFYRLITPPSGGGKYTLTVYWTRKPANPDGREQVSELFADSYTKYEEKALRYDDNGVAGFRAHRKWSTYKGYIYELGLAKAVAEWPEFTSEVSGGTGARKNYAWAMRSNAYERIGLWLYPTWNPLDDSQAKMNNTEPLTVVTKTGDTGVAYVLIW